MKEEYGILVIYTDKETGEYKSFEIYPRKIEKDFKIRNTLDSAKRTKSKIVKNK